MDRILTLLRILFGFLFKPEAVDWHIGQFVEIWNIEPDILPEYYALYKHTNLRGYIIDIKRRRQKVTKIKVRFLHFTGLRQTGKSISYNEKWYTLRMNNIKPVK